MEAKLLPSHLCSSKPTTPFLILNQHSPFITQKISLRPSLHRVARIKATINGNGEDIASSTPQPEIPPPQDGSKLRFRRVSRRRGSRDKDMDNNGENNKPVKKKAPPKDWDSMTYGEKAMELYVGEKGLLFWLNKFAYASIYIIIGAWIIFRFVGPSLGFYQLDTPPLSPTDVLKGSK